MRTQALTLATFTGPDLSLPLRFWLRRLRTRTVLRELDARGLEDIGLSEDDRQRECAKWFWQA